VDLEAAIRRLPLWRGSLTIDPLPGGITNVNFKVQDEQGTFAVRAGEDATWLGIDRRNELQCARIAARLGVAPEIVFAEPPWTVAAFVTGPALGPRALTDHARLRRVASLLRTVHDARAAVTGHLRWFSPFLVARTYLELARVHGHPLPFDGDSLARRVDDLEARLLPFRPAFCHNDLMPGNLLEDRDRIWLIDWEYAGIGHPLFDVAGLASNAGLDAPATSALLDAWLEGSDLDPTAARGQLAILLPMAALRECLWAVVQGAHSTIAFDYGTYRDDNFAKFERALASLRRDTGADHG
jgi:thiamine kinase-like enzyme